MAKQDDTRFVKQTMTGYHDVQGGQSDFECTHVIMPIDEYHALYDKLHKERDQKYKAENEKKESINRAKNDAERHIEQIRKEANDQLEEKNQVILDLQSKIEIQQDINGKLLKINRELTNKDRNLRPVKSRSGFLVLSSRQKKFCYDTTNHYFTTIWETKIQTPYSVEFSSDEVTDLLNQMYYMNDDGTPTIYSDVPLGMIGLYGEYVWGFKKGEYQNHINANYIVEKNLNNNYKTGYWELILDHIHELRNVPEDMMSSYYKHS